MFRKAFRGLLEGDRVILVDGGLGTQLQVKGLPVGRGPERWVEENPAAVQEVHQAYFDAGSQIVQSCTFGAHPLKLQADGLGDRFEAINTKAVALVRTCCPPEGLVGGDMGPSGLLLAPAGDGDPTTIEDGYRRQAELLLDGGVDLFFIETMFDMEEAILAVRAIRSVTVNHPILVTGTFGSSPRGFFTMMGHSPKEMLSRLEEEGADAVGANCTVGAEEMVDLVEEMKAATGLPLIAQANAGQPRLEDGVPVYDQEPEEFTRCVVQMVQKGARIVGGCCGTTPLFISHLHKALQDRLP